MLCDECEERFCIGILWFWTLLWTNQSRNESSFEFLNNYWVGEVDGDVGDEEGSNCEEKKKTKFMMGKGDLEFKIVLLKQD